MSSSENKSNIEDRDDPENEPDEFGDFSDYKDPNLDPKKFICNSATPLEPLE